MALRHKVLLISKWGLIHGGSHAILSEYDGTSPASEEVRKACGVLVQPSCEGFKFYPAQKGCTEAVASGETRLVKECNPCLPLTLRNWHDIADRKIQSCLKTLLNPGYRTEASFPNIPGILTTDDAFSTVAVSPYNKTPMPYRNHAMTWNWTPLDDQAALDDKPHVLSEKFVGQFPYVPEIEQCRPLSRRICVAVTGPLARMDGLHLGTWAMRVKIGAAAAAAGEKATSQALDALEAHKKAAALEAHKKSAAQAQKKSAAFEQYKKSLK